MKEPKLLPCPFCGESVAWIVPNGIGDYYVVCGSGDEAENPGCGASTDDYKCESKVHAAERWNRRRFRKQVKG